MGMLRSANDHAGLTVSGVTLGDSARWIGNRPAGDNESPTEHRWDHPLLPNGTINADGTMTIDTPEEI